MMAKKIPYSDVMSRMKNDIDYIAEEAYTNGYEQATIWCGKANEESYQRGLSEGHDIGYKKGLEDGKQTAVGAAELREKLEYQKGFKDGKAINDKGCEGCKYQANKELTCPCSECANNYKNQWTAKSPIDDGFVRGDVVVDEDGTRGIVVSSENNESNLLYVLFKGYRVPQSVVRKHYKKTGEHYDIDKFLDEVKGDSDK